MNLIVTESALRIVIKRRNLRSPVGAQSRTLARALLQCLRVQRVARYEVSFGQATVTLTSH